MHRIEATKVVLEQVDDRPIVSNLGPTTDELWHAGHRDRNFYTWGSMGLCYSIALGMALSTDEQIISLDGDGSLLMNTNLEQVARGCGIPCTATVSSEEQLETVLKEALNSPGPWFIVAKIEEAEHLPYAPIEPEMTLYRFRATFKDAESNPLTEPWLYTEQSS